MASLKAIRRRIGSVKNTQKITKAMKLVAAAKLRRAQENVIRVRPYADRLRDLIAELAARAEEAEHPLLAEREPRRVMLLVFTSDRGLCGAFNINALRAVEQYRSEHGSEHEQLELAVLGKKGQRYFNYRKVALARQFAGVDVESALERAREVTNQIIEAFLGPAPAALGQREPQLDKVLLIYNEFKSAMTQKVAVEQLLPIIPAAAPAGAPLLDYLYEPSKTAVLDTILPLYVEYELYRAASEATASEYGARMTAMDNATNNATEMIAHLTLQYNKARQAAITKELLEIVGGAEALRG